MVSVPRIHHVGHICLTGCLPLYVSAASGVAERKRHLDGDESRLSFCAVLFVCVALEDTAVALDEFDHDFVTDVLVPHRVETRSHTAKGTT